MLRLFDVFTMSSNNNNNNKKNVIYTAFKNTIGCYYTFTFRKNDYYLFRKKSIISAWPILYYMKK